eukprot:745319_1
MSLHEASVQYRLLIVKIPYISSSRITLLAFIFVYILGYHTASAFRAIPDEIDNPKQELLQGPSESPIAPSNTDPDLSTIKSREVPKDNFIKTVKFKDELEFPTSSPNIQISTIDTTMRPNITSE